MRAWKYKQVVDFDQSTTTVKEERNKTLHQTKLSIIFSFGYIDNLDMPFKVHITDKVTMITVSGFLTI